MNEEQVSDRQLGYNEAMNGLIKAIQLGQTSNSAPPGYSFVMMNEADMRTLGEMMEAFRKQQPKTKGSCYGCCPSGVPCGKPGCPGGGDAVQQG
jgi:hypothetical protein